MDRLPELIAQNRRILDQGAALIERMDGEQFRATGPGFETGSIGTQFRHVLDFYGCLLKGLPGGHVDYDDRPRDERLEQQPEAALARLRQIQSQLASLGEDGPLTVSLDDTGSGDPVVSTSSLARELQFLQSHVVHHYAIIGFVARALDLPVDTDFGVATSTLRFWAGVR